LAARVETVCRHASLLFNYADKNTHDFHRGFYPDLARYAAFMMRWYEREDIELTTHEIAKRRVRTMAVQSALYLPSGQTASPGQFDKQQFLPKALPWKGPQTMVVQEQTIGLVACVPS
jgi:hypothetical protein